MVETKRKRKKRQREREDGREGEREGKRVKEERNFIFGKREGEEASYFQNCNNVY